MVGPPEIQRASLCYLPRKTKPLVCQIRDCPSKPGHKQLGEMFVGWHVEYLVEVLERHQGHGLALPSSIRRCAANTFGKVVPGYACGALEIAKKGRQAHLKARLFPASLMALACNDRPSALPFGKVAL